MEPVDGEALHAGRVKRIGPVMKPFDPRRVPPNDFARRFGAAYIEP